MDFTDGVIIAIFCIATPLWLVLSAVTRTLAATRSAWSRLGEKAKRWLTVAWPLLALWLLVNWVKGQD